MAIHSAHILIGSLRGGDAVSRHTFDLVRLLRDRGIDARVFAESFTADLPPDLQAITRVTPYADYTPTSGLTILQYASWYPLAERLREATGPTLFWYHGVTPPQLAGSDTGRVQFQISRQRTTLAAYAHLVVADSPFTAWELHHHTAYPRDRIQVVPLAIPIADFAHKPDAAILAGLRRRWGLEQKRVLLYVGRIAGNKGIDLLVDALALLRPDYPDLHLLIVGDTEQNEAARRLTAQLRQQAAPLGVSGQITWTGRVPQVEPYYHLAQIALLPSRHEGFGVPVVEAMAAGVPVIASTEGALPWVMGAGEEDRQADEAAGLPAAPDDAADLARQIRRLLDDPTLYAEMARRGHIRAQTFSQDRFAANVAQLLEAVEQAAQAGPPPGHAAQNRLYDHADIALRGYAVRSGIPVVGTWVAAIRRALTSHVKEPYLDFIVERQVNYNQLLAAEVERLQAEVKRLQAEIEALRRNPPAE